MDSNKKNAIQNIINREIKQFADTYEIRFTSEIDNPEGVINSKKNNCFVAELGKEFMFYSAFVRSFDSSFGKVLEKIGNEIAKLSYDVRGNIKSFLLPQQSQHIDYIILEYEKHTKPKVSDYCDFTCMIPTDTRSFEKSHVTDHYFYNPEKKEHYLIELKEGNIDYWYIRYVDRITSDEERKKALTAIYGEFAKLKLGGKIKVSCATPSYEDYDYFVTIPPYQLNTNASIIHFDSELERFADETFLETALPLKENIPVKDFCNLTESLIL